MFYNCNNLNYTILEGILHKISLSKLESMEEMFCGCSTLNSFILENITFLELVNINGMLSGKHPDYYISFRNLKFPKLTSIIFLFNGVETNFCTPEYYYTINFENIDLPNVLTLENSFSSYCYYHLKNLNMKNISIPKVKSMANMFPWNVGHYCNISLQNIYAPSVETIERMFSYIYYTNVNFKNINFSSLKSVQYTFDNSFFQNLNLENIDALNVESLDNMFSHTVYNASFKNINFSNAISMKYFLPNEIHNISFINVNISKVTSLEEIFTSASCLLNLRLENVDISSVTSMKNMIGISVLNSYTKEIIIKNINASNLLDLKLNMDLMQILL